MSTEVPMYLRIKRRNQTYFVLCKPTDTIQSLKEQISIASKGEYTANQMRMILPSKNKKGNTTNNTILNDDDTIDKHEDHLKNESELYVVFQIADGEWEQVNIEDPQASYDDDE